MDIHDYSKKALRTDYVDYSDFHTGDGSARLDYGVIGLVTESAKALDLIKKSKKNLTPLSKEKLREELGDLFWYLNITIDELGLTFDDLMQNNLQKIERKYPLGDGQINNLIRGQ
jgi:NTP pyrophosphatase (non-canonical NTP hydrolase)